MSCCIYYNVKKFMESGLKVRWKLARTSLIKLFCKVCPVRETNPKSFCLFSFIISHLTATPQCHKTFCVINCVKLARCKAVFTLAKVGAIMPATMKCESDTLVLALATLRGVTINRNSPICVMSPKVAKASTVVTGACCCCRQFR
jgi:hypothetical protein